MMLPEPLISLILLATAAHAQNTATGTVEVAAAAATAKTSSPTSNVKGKVFDRFAVIWLENTDYDKAIGDRKLPSFFITPKHRSIHVIIHHRFRV
jgi:acid phosphatase